MKKALLLVPAAGAILVLVLFLWHRGFQPPAAPPARPPLPPPPLAAESGDPHEHAHAPPSPAYPAGTPPGSLLLRVTGRGAALAEVDVSLLRGNGEGRMRTRTGPDGARLILQMPPGSYTATAFHPRFLPTEIHVSVAPGLRTTADLELKPGARIFGRITDATGAPLPGSTAQPIDPESRMPHGPQTGAQAGPDGRYELPALARGSYGLRFKHPKFKFKDHLGVQVSRDDEEIEVNAVLEPGGRIEGRVVDDQGAPLAKARVLFGNAGGSGVTETDAEGRFGIYGLTEAPCGGSASLKGYGTAYRRGVAPGTADVEFRLSRGGAIAGRVVAEPMPEQFVVILSRYEPELGRPLRIQTKALTEPPGGAFDVDDLAPGTWTVEVEAHDYEGVDRPEVTVSAGQTSGGLTIRLRKK